MYDQNDVKLDWMYKGPNSTVNREDYLLGRSVDKPLEELNAQENQKKNDHLMIATKNRVEHECIPPSIRDFNKVVQSEQVDLSTKLQEDPLVLIKKREEETRRAFLQNPIQLKKLQKALKAQEKKKQKKEKKKKHKKKHQTDDDLDEIITKKLKSLSKLTTDDNDDDKKSTKKDSNLDIILMHKFNSLKSKLSEKDLQNILKDIDSEDEDESRKRKYSSSSEEECQQPRKNYGLIKADGTKIISSKSKIQTNKPETSIRKPTKEPTAKTIDKRKTKLTEKEKEKLRLEMMQNAVERDSDRNKRVKNYRKKQEEEDKKKPDFKPEFIHKELMKSVQSSSVEDRIKANRNNIQRSHSDMQKHFSRR